MRIVSWNMNYWQQAAMNEAAWDFLLNKVNPDIALLQETVIPEKYKSLNTIFRQAYGSLQWGSCIYLKKDTSFFDKTDLIFKDVGKEYEGKQIAGEVSLGGKNILLITVHINTTDTNNTDVDTIIKKHSDFIMNNKVICENANNPIILGGDFNVDDSISYFKERNNKFKSIGFHECSPEFSQTFFGWNAKKHLQDDHIFIGKVLEPKLIKFAGENVKDEKFDSFTWNYGMVKYFSDHTIIEIKLDL